MAKVGFWLQGARGKLAGSVLQKGEGGTIVRNNVKPKNPKTPKQLAQRIVFATVTQAARFMDPIINHSFEGFANGAKSRREFIRLNLDKLRALAALDWKEAPDAIDANVFMTTKRISALIPNSYIVSRGSLAAPAGIKLVTTGRATTEQKINYSFEAQEIPVRKDGTNIKATVKDILTAWGIDSPNTQLSVVMITIDQDRAPIYTFVDADGGVIKEAQMVAQRMVPNPNYDFSTEIIVGTVDAEDAFTPTQAEVWLPQLAAAFDMSKTSMLFLQSALSAAKFSDYSPETNTVIMEAETQTAQVGAGDIAYAACLIRSKLVGTSWLRSNATMITLPPIHDRHNYGLTWAFAGDAWRQEVELAASEEFLDEGEEGGSIDG